MEHLLDLVNRLVMTIERHGCFVERLCQFTNREVLDAIFIGKLKRFPANDVPRQSLGCLGAVLVFAGAAFGQSKPKAQTLTQNDL